MRRSSSTGAFFDDDFDDDPGLGAALFEDAFAVGPPVGAVLFSLPFLGAMLTTLRWVSSVRFFYCLMLASVGENA